jgi:hypothetical protein
METWSSLTCLEIHFGQQTHLHFVQVKTQLDSEKVLISEIPQTNISMRNASTVTKLTKVSGKQMDFL